MCLIFWTQPSGSEIVVLGEKSSSLLSRIHLQFSWILEVEHEHCDIFTTATDGKQANLKVDNAFKKVQCSYVQSSYFNNCNAKKGEKFLITKFVVTWEGKS